MVRKEKYFMTYRRSNKELNAIIEKKFQKFVKKKQEKEETEKELQHFQEMQIL